MAQVLEYNIKVNDGKAIQTLGQLENELEQINTQLKNTKVNDKAFTSLSKKSQILKRDIDKVNKSVEGMTLDKKLETADGAIKVMAGSIQSATGAIGMLGLESEAFDKLTAQATNAIAFGTGIKDLSEGFGKLAKNVDLAKVKTMLFSTAQKALNAVQVAFNAILAMNPLGVLIVSLTAVGVLIYKFRDSILNLIKNALGPFKGIVDKIAGAFNDLAVSVGLVDDEQTKLTKANIKRMEKELALAKAKGEDTIKLEKDLLKEKSKLLEEGTDDYENNLLEQEILDINANKKKTSADEALAKEEEAKRKERLQKKKEADEQAQQAYLTLLQKYSDEELNLLADTDAKKLELDKARALAEIDNLTATEEEKQALRLQYLETYNLKKEELDNAQFEKDKAKEAERFIAQQDLDLELDALKAETDQEKRDVEVANVQTQYDRLIAEAKKNGDDTTTLEQIKAEKIKKIDGDLTDKKIANAEAEAQMKEQALNQSVDAIQGALTNLFGESKAIASANVLVDAGQAAVGIIKSSTSIPAPFNIPFQVAQFALLATTTMSSLKQINSAKPTQGGGGSPSRPNVSRGASVPTTPTNIGQAPETNIDNQSVRAYVVGGDITSTQEANAKINSKRTLG
jgi:hypothetical protein